MTKEEMLDIEYKKFISNSGMVSIYTPNFPAAFIKPALTAMEEWASYCVTKYHEEALQKDETAALREQLEDQAKIIKELKKIK